MGGGRCFYDADANGNIDCGLCPSQTKCAGSPCAMFTDPCLCVASPSVCAWSTGTNRCVGRGARITPCSACPSQEVCNLPKPTTTAFDPMMGGKGSGNNNVLQVVFSVEMKWCDALATHSVSFWCDGSMAKSLSDAHLYILSRALKVDIADAIRGLSRTTQRRCGLTIPTDLLCNRQTSAPFAGIARGAYWFTLSDTMSPTLIS